jgi:perosamine synthetase
MTPRPFQIPSAQPLPPALVFSSRRNFESAFSWPFTATRYYYLARNAIWHGLRHVALREGDGVLMPAYNHGVEVDVVLARGLVPTYYRIDDQMQVDLGHLKSAIAPGTRALYVTHYLGFPQPIVELRAFARERGLALIEDCALALFSRAPAGPLGSFGDFSVFCLYKTLPVPHGGALVWNRSDVAPPAVAAGPDWFSTASYVSHRLLDALQLDGSPLGMGRMVPWIRGLARRAKGAAGAKAIPIDTERFEERRADLGMSRLARHILDRTDGEWVVSRRREHFLALARAIRPEVRAFFRELPGGVCPLSFPIRVTDKPAVQARLMERGVGAINMWFRSHRDIPADRFPEVTRLRQELLEIPIHQSLQPRHIEFIAAQVNELVPW